MANLYSELKYTKYTFFVFFYRHFQKYPREYDWYIQCRQPKEGAPHASVFITAHATLLSACESNGSQFNAFVRCCFFGCV